VQQKDVPGDAEPTTYAQILRSTSLIGLSSVINIVFSIIRMKALAVLLGPAGVGLYGLYSLVADLATNLAGLGAQASGVRQVAEAAGGGDTARLGRAIAVLERVSLALGVLGAALLALLAVPVARLTFGSALEAPGVALLGIAVFLRLAAGAPTAAIQGMRRIGDLARMTVLGAGLGTAATIPLVYFFGPAGIVPALLAASLATLLAALWYRRRIAIPAAPLTLPQVREEAGALLRLGFAFMASALLTVGAAYAIRILILQRVGVEAAGLYQAAWGVGGLYAGFILQAMGTDFYPRLTGVARDHVQCNRLVNEQAQVSMLLAGPGLIATMTLAPLVLAVFYSAEFQPAVTLLRWLCLGMLLRIVAWPMGFIVLAKGAQRIFFWTEVAAAVVQVGLATLLLPVVGLTGAGVAFFGLYVWHGVLIYILVRRLTGFAWSATNLRLGAICIAGGGAVFLAVSALPFWPGVMVGLAATVVASFFSLGELIRLLPIQWFPGALRPLLLRFAYGRTG
jgi:O-antigen/teichoic acid export membrane protein